MTKTEIERLEELQNMAPDDAWDIFVGSQSVFEFVEIYRDQGVMDFNDMVYDYTEALATIFTGEMPYSETEKKIIHDKLHKYIEYVIKFWEV